MRRLLFVSLFSFLYFQTNSTKAQEESYISLLRKSGSLVNVEIIPQGKMIRLNVVGNNVANFYFPDASAKAFKKSGAQLEILPVTRHESYFLIQNPGKEQSLHLEIKYKNQTERFEFQLPKKP